jgi:uncharacterized protein DUF5615
VLRLAADENFNGRIVRGLRRRLPDLDLLRVQDTPVSGADDDELLDWAVRENRIVLTHDVSTLVEKAWRRVKEGRAMRGVVAVGSDAPIGEVVSDLALLVLAGTVEDVEARVLYLPF